MSPSTQVGTTIRAATWEDLPLVSQIESESFSDPWSERSFGEILLAPTAIFLVAARSESPAIVGYVIALVVQNEGEILNLAVAHEFRRRGLGGELLDAGLSSVHARGARDIFLEVRESNQPALALYGSRGFSAIGQRRRYYKNPVEDALVLRRADE